MDFDKAPEHSALFFYNLEAALFGPIPYVVIDHRPLKELSPAAALVLTATLFRSTHKRRDLLIEAFLPSTAGPRDLLGQIGYYKYFPDEKWVQPLENSRYFLEHIKSEKVRPEFAEKLCNHFLLSGRSNSQRSKLYAALIEGMANAEEWGYGKKKGGYQFWWILGYRDADTGEIAYSFYDQGEGIPITIRRKKWLDVFPLMTPNGSELIEQGVEKGRFSRTRDPARGTGLPILLDFVKGGADGELLIYSHRSRCVFQHGEPTTRDDYGFGLRGTLISWSFRAI